MNERWWGIEVGNWEKQALLGRKGQARDRYQVRETLRDDDDADG